jgi:hypothetical protein
MNNKTPNSEEAFKAMIMLILSLEIEVRAFQVISTERVRTRVCLN